MGEKGHRGADVISPAVGGDPWALYDRMIDKIPSGIAVRDFCQGVHWCYVEAECGMGVARVVRGGGRHTFSGEYLSLDLRGIAELAKSWDFIEASMGMAALGAWYNTAEHLRELGALMDEGAGGPGDAGRDAKGGSTGSDPAGLETSCGGVEENPFHARSRDYAGKKVAVVGHFPNVEVMCRTAQVTVLERECRSDLDVPDPACEYILPSQDFVFMTGTTLTNKTAPRLMQLSRNAYSAMVGPTSVASADLMDAGLDEISGSYVADPAPAKVAVKGGSKAQWRAGIRKFCWMRGEPGKRQVPTRSARA